MLTNMRFTTFTYQIKICTLSSIFSQEHQKNIFSKTNFPVQNKFVVII